MRFGKSDTANPLCQCSCVKKREESKHSQIHISWIGILPSAGGRDLHCTENSLIPWTTSRLGLSYSSQPEKRKAWRVIWRAKTWHFFILQHKNYARSHSGAYKKDKCLELVAWWKLEGVNVLREATKCATVGRTPAVTGPDVPWVATVALPNMWI